MAVKWREEDDNEQKDIGCGKGRNEKDCRRNCERD